MSSFKIRTLYKTIVLGFAFIFRLYSQLHFLADGCLEDVLFVCADRLPVLYAARIVGPRGFVVSKENEWNLIVCVKCRCGRDRSNSCSPHVVTKYAKASYLPSLLMADAASFIEDGGLGGSKGDEDVVGKNFDHFLLHTLREFDESE